MGSAIIPSPEPDQYFIMPDRRQQPSPSNEMLQSQLTVVETKLGDVDGRLATLEIGFGEYKAEISTKVDELIIRIDSNKASQEVMHNNIKSIVDWTENFTGFIKVVSAIKKGIIGGGKAIAFLLVLGTIAQVAYSTIVDHGFIVLPDVIPNNKEPK